MMWVAVVMLCNSPIISTCNIVGKPTGFAEEEACLNDVNSVLKYLWEQKVFAKGTCMQITFGEAV